MNLRWVFCVLRWGRDVKGIEPGAYAADLASDGEHGAAQVRTEAVSVNLAEFWGTAPGGGSLFDLPRNGEGVLHQFRGGHREFLSDDNHGLALLAYRFGVQSDLLDAARHVCLEESTLVGARKQERSTWSKRNP